VHLVLAEGCRSEPVPRVEVHRRGVSRGFLCADDRRVFAIVTDEAPPRPIRAFTAREVDALADLLCARFGLATLTGGPMRLRVRPGVSTVRADHSERTVALGRSNRMPKTTKRKGGARGGARGGRRSGGRSAAGRKGGNATLRSRGPEFYSEIGRKGGRSRSRKARRSTSTARGGRRSSSSSRGGSRTGRRQGGSRSMRRSSR
jgi:hypothetical protein